MCADGELLICSYSKGRDHKPVPGKVLVLERTTVDPNSGFADR